MAPTITEDVAPSRRIEHWDDIMYGATFDAHEHYVNVRAFTIYKMSDGSYEYQDAEAHSSPSPVADIDKAETFVRGSIKWDGCSNLEFNDDEVMLHFCSKEGAMNVGVLLGRLYDVAREMMPGADWS
jgi:hypothetical protein